MIVFIFIFYLIIDFYFGLLFMDCVLRRESYVKFIFDSHNVLWFVYNVGLYVKVCSRLDLLGNCILF